MYVHFKQKKRRGPRNHNTKEGSKESQYKGGVQGDSTEGATLLGVKDALERSSPYLLNLFFPSLGPANFLYTCWTKFGRFATTFMMEP